MSNCCSDFSCPRCKATRTALNDYMAGRAVKRPYLINEAAQGSLLMKMHLLPPWERPAPLVPALQRDFLKRNEQIQDRVKANAAARAASKG